MRKFITGAAGIIAAAFAAGSSEAADFGPVVKPTVAPVIVDPVRPVFDWAGLYAGTVVGFYHPFAPADAIIVGGAAGFNFVRGPLVLGVEGQADWFHYFGGGGDYFFGLARGRAGLALGAEDRILVYGAAGAGFYSPFTEAYVTLAAGVELGIGDRLSFRSEATGFIYPGWDVEFQWTTGLFFHFGDR